MQRNNCIVLIEVTDIMKKWIISCIAVLMLTLGLASPLVSADNQQGKSGQKLPVRILILPKFEVGEITGDYPGEAQLFMKSIFPEEMSMKSRGARARLSCTIKMI